MISRHEVERVMSKRRYRAYRNRDQEYVYRKQALLNKGLSARAYELEVQRIAKELGI